MRKGKTADDMERIKQIKSVNVERGLLLVRYASADNENLPPKVRVVVGPRHQRDIELVLNPDHDDAVLWQPGNCLVVRASKPGQLVVEVIPTAKGSTAATVQIEALSQGKASVAGLGQSMAEVDFGRFSLLAHVAGAGMSRSVRTNGLRARMRPRELKDCRSTGPIGRTTWMSAMP